MDSSNLVALAGIIASAIAGTGGGGYALIQWWVKRHDDEAKANAARILTSAAGSIITELKAEKAELKADLALFDQKIADFRRVVSAFISAVEEVLPLLEQSRVVYLRDTMRRVREQL
jgi:hypothetical protein